MFNAGICASNIHQDPHFFDIDQRYNQGIEFYSRHYEHCLQNEHVNNNQDVDSTKYIMDATSGTLWNANRVHETYTQAGIETHTNLKIIVILREPISRELSLYHSKVKQWKTLRDLVRGDNTENDVQHHNFHDVVFTNGTIMTFDQHVELVLKDIISDDTYLGRGTDSKYIDHLKQWTTYFNRSQILILSHDEYIQKPKDVQLRIQGFLGVGLDGELKSNHGMIRKISKGANSILEPLFEKKNEELYEFLTKEHDGPDMEQVSMFCILCFCIYTYCIWEMTFDSHTSFNLSSLASQTVSISKVYGGHNNCGGP